MVQELNESQITDESREESVTKIVLDMPCILKTLKAEQCKILGNQLILDFLEISSDDVWRYYSMSSLFKQLFVKGNTHTTMSCLNAEGKTVMKFKI